MIKAYLDSYDKITVEVSKNYYDGKISSLFLLTDYGPEFLGDLLYVKEEKNFKRYTLKMEMDIELGKEYYLIDEYVLHLYMYLDDYINTLMNLLYW